MAEQKKIQKQVDVVSQDRNWVIRINNESDSEKKWDSQWGHLSQGFNPDKTGVKTSINDKIKQLENEIKEIDGNIFSRTNDAYGKGHKVQIFDNSKFNIHENKDLRALERRLPKGWKKQKWTPPVDPYDPLSKKK